MLSGFAIGDPYAAGPQFPASRLVENRLRLDIWELQRAGSLTPGAATAISLEGNPVGWVRPLSGSRILVELAALKREIRLVEDMPMPGVPRLWFQCPVCEKRCRHIYLPELQCRCLGLEHACRHRRLWDNAARVSWLRRRLGADLTPFAEIPPPQRRGRRWRRLTEQIAQEERKLLGGLRRFVAAVEKEAPDADR